MSQDEQKIRIHLLDDQSVYSLCCIRIVVRIDAKCLSDAILTRPSTTEDENRRTSNATVNALSDQAVRVVFSIIGMPKI